MAQPPRRKDQEKDLYYCSKCQKWKHFRHFRSRLEGIIPCLVCENLAKRRPTTKLGITDYQQRAWVDRYKTVQGCLLCREKDPQCLDLHHVDPSAKDAEVAKLIGTSLSKIKREVAKCIVVCSNCHRRLHRWLQQPTARQFINDLRSRDSTPSAFRELLRELAKHSPDERAKLAPSRSGTGVELMELRSLVDRQVTAIVVVREIVVRALAQATEPAILEALEQIRRAVLG